MPTWGKPFNSLAKEAKRPASSRPTRVRSRSRKAGDARRERRTSEPSIPKYRSRKMSLEMNSVYAAIIRTIAAAAYRFPKPLNDWRARGDSNL
jgi:hypothetical protein